MTKLQDFLKAVRERTELAHRHICDLSAGRRKWKMSAPSQKQRRWWKMTKQEMLAERDRLADLDSRSGTSVGDDSIPIEIYRSIVSCAYKRAFNSALELMERERVKPLREALKRINRFDMALKDIRHYSARDACQDMMGVAHEALAKVPEFE